MDPAPTHEYSHDAQCTPSQNGGLGEPAALVLECGRSDLMPLQLWISLRMVFCRDFNVSTWCSHGRQDPSSLWSGQAVAKILSVKKDSTISSTRSRSSSGDGEIHLVSVVDLSYDVTTDTLVVYDRVCQWDALE